MAKQPPGPPALLAEFASEDALVAAAEALRRRGIRRLAAYTPIPSPRADQVIGQVGRAVPMVALACGLTGAAATFGLQYLSSVPDYPFLVGGKPYFSWPPFLVVAFAIGLLSAVLGAFAAMLAGNRLPRLSHPVFDVEGIEGASRDRWFLAAAGDEGNFDEAALREAIGQPAPLSVAQVPE